MLSDDDIRFIHRKAKDTDIYWINKPSDDFRTVEVSLRSCGRRPMAWNPVDGSIREVGYRIEDGCRRAYFSWTIEVNSGRGKDAGRGVYS